MKVTFFPKSTINVSVCEHIHGAVASISHGTDTLKITSRYAAELFAFKNNISLTVFDNSFSDNAGGDKKEMHETGRAKFAIYFPTDRWWDGSGYNLIPDYYSSIWTSEGASAFANAVEGQTKLTRYPNHGQQMYDISNGVYGYDFISQNSGTNNLIELYALADNEKYWLKNIIGETTSAISYRNGQDGGGYLLLTKFLGGRDSGFSYSNNSYIEYSSSSRAEDIKRANSTRVWDTWKAGLLSENEAIEYSKNQIQFAITENGWFQDFMHWHSAYDYSYLEFFDLLYSSWDLQIGNNFVNRSSFNKIIEYKYLRDSIKRIACFEKGSSIYIVAQIANPHKGTTYEGIEQDIIYSLINTPISFQLDLAGTSLQGSDIKSDGAGIRKISTDNFIIDANLSNYREGFITVKIDTTLSPNYQDFSLPTITSCTETNGVLSISTNIDSKLAIFWKAREAAQKEARILTRSNVCQTTHLLDLNQSNIRNYYNEGGDPKTVNEILAGDIYVGVISNYGQSILSNVYQFA